MIGRIALGSIAALALCGAALGVAPAPAYAQAVTAAFHDFSGNSKEPVHIEADRLDVRQNDQAAVFSGRVVVVQGKSTLRTKKLTIDYYDTNKPDHTKSTAGTRPGAAKPAPTTSAAPPPAQPHHTAAPAQPMGAAVMPGGNSRDIRSMTADGKVVVTSGDQRATGTHGVFNMASNTVILTGNVVLTQGENVLRGQRLVVDLTSQHSRLESNTAGGRVQGLFIPGQGQAGAAKPAGSQPSKKRHAKP